MTEGLPPELETLTAAQVAASFGRSRGWWSRVRRRYEGELGFPAPLVILADARNNKTGRGRVPDLVYNKEAVIAWHRRNAPAAGAPQELPCNLDALAQRA